MGLQARVWVQIRTMVLLLVTSDLEHQRLSSAGFIAVCFHKPGLGL